jgi:hypothetical protein
MMLTVPGKQGRSFCVCTKGNFHVADQTIPALSAGHLRLIFLNIEQESFMAENKGKPSGSVAQTKKDAGKQGDIKEIGATAGAKKKSLSSRAGLMAVAGGHSRKK